MRFHSIRFSATAQEVDRDVRRIRVLLADDHPRVLERIQMLLEDSFEIVGVLSDGQTVLDLIDRLRPDILVMDISMPLLSGLQIARKLKETGHPARIIFLTVHDDPDYFQEARDLGAAGYVLKHRLATDLYPALKDVAAGGTFFSPSACSE